MDAPKGIHFGWLLDADLLDGYGYRDELFPAICDQTRNWFTLPRALLGWNDVACS